MTNETRLNLLVEIQSWLKMLGYKAPEVIEEDRKDFIERIDRCLLEDTDG